MEIDGQIIDTEAIVKEAFAKRNEALDFYFKEFEPYDTEELEHYKDPLEKEIFIGMYEALEKKTCSPLSMRDAALGLMAHGLSKDDIRCRTNAYRVRLPNRKYLLRRIEDVDGFEPFIFNEDGKATFPCEVICGITPSQFADLLFGFDEFLPKIKDQIEAYMDKVRERYREVLKNNKIREITRKTVDMNCQRYLSPRNIHYDISVNPNGMVTVELERVQRAKVSLPMDKLCQWIKDADAVIGSLEDVPCNVIEQEKHTRYGYTI